MENVQTMKRELDSREVAEMVEKTHGNLVRDLKKYTNQLNQCKIEPVEFFQESTYKDGKGEMRTSYKVTKKGCEFIAHKLTGVKGTIFTAKYINRFHEMQDLIVGERQREKPWFVRKFRGRDIVLERDFIEVTGIDIRKNRLFYRKEYFTGGADFNGWGWKCDNDKFKEEYGFNYGDSSCLIYLYPCGVRKALRLLEQDKQVHMNQDAKKLLLGGLQSVEPPLKMIEKKEGKKTSDEKQVKITIILNRDEVQSVVY